MCLVTEQLEPKIAEEDITVYKLVQKPRKYVKKSKVCSPYRDFTYKLGKLYKTKFSELAPEQEEYTSLFDTEASNMYRYRLIEIQRKSIPPRLKVIAEGFHSAVSTKRFGYYGIDIIAECTIPKESEYYLDSTGLCVSNQIIINKLL